LGSVSKFWGNAYINNLNVDSIDVSQNLNPQFTIGANLGSSTRRWNIAYINNLDVSFINGAVWGTGTGTNFAALTSNIIPATHNIYTLGSITRVWRNAYIQDLSVGSIDISTNNLNPLNNNVGSLGTSSKPWNNANFTTLNVTNINVLTTLNPVTSNTIRLGVVGKIWASSYIKQLFLSLQSTGAVDGAGSGVALLVSNLSNTANSKSIVHIRCEPAIGTITAANGCRAGLSLDINQHYGWQITVRQPIIGRTNQTLFFNTQWNGTATNNVDILEIDGANGSPNTTARLTYKGAGGVWASSVQLTSDDRLKHNEIIINNGLAIIDQLTPKFYQKTTEMLDANYNGDLSGYVWSYEAGLIAQEVLQINDISQVVFDGDYYDENNELIKRQYGLNYNSVFTYGLAAIKELHTKVKYQEATILSLQTNILSQETTILDQQTIINSLIARIEAIEN
jgi:hypothetical protein